MERRLRIAFGLVILAQAAHSVEEYVFQLYEVFAPARWVSGLFSANASVGFAIANAILVLFGIWCYWARVRPGHPSARGYAWFWACLEFANGVNHLLVAAIRGAYFPGAWTAPLLIATSCYLGATLMRIDAAVLARVFVASTIANLPVLGLMLVPQLMRSRAGSETLLMFGATLYVVLIAVALRTTPLVSAWAAPKGRVVVSEDRERGGEGHLAGSAARVLAVRGRVVRPVRRRSGGRTGGRLVGSIHRGQSTLRRTE